MFSAQKPECSRRFWEIYPAFLQTCSVSPCRPVNEGSVCVFRRGFGKHHGPNTPRKMHDQISGEEKRRKKNTVTSRARRTRVVQIFIIFIPKTALTSDSWLFMGFGWTSLYAKVLHLPSDNVCSVSANNQKHATLLIFLHHALQNSCRHFCLFSSYRYFSYISGLACFVVFSHQVR